MENGSLTASDVALLSRNDGMGLGGGWLGIIFIIAILFLFNGGAFGGNQSATSNEVQRGFDTQNLQAQTRDILSAVNDGTSQAVAATNQAKYDNINVAKDIENMVLSQIGEVKVAQAQALANQNECCSATRLQIAEAIAATNANVTAQVQSVKDMISQDKIEALQAQLNKVQLEQAVAGIPRVGSTYPGYIYPFVPGFPGFPGFPGPAPVAV